MEQRKGLWVGRDTARATEDLEESVVCESRCEGGEAWQCQEKRLTDKGTSSANSERDDHVTRTDRRQDRQEAGNQGGKINWEGIVTLALVSHILHHHFCEALLKTV